MEKQHSVITWGWKEQIDIEEVNRILRVFGYTGCIQKVETESDHYAVVITDRLVGVNEANKIYQDEMDGLLDEAEGEFRDFTSSDWMGYQGAERKDGQPRIMEITCSNGYMFAIMIDDNGYFINGSKMDGEDHAWWTVKDWFKSEEAFEAACLEVFKPGMEYSDAMTFIDFVATKN